MLWNFFDHFQKYCFQGSDAVKFATSKQGASTSENLALFLVGYLTTLSLTGEG
jgi:hypothetical protein